MATTHGFGWIPDLPDQRDHIYAAPISLMAAMATKVDLRPQCPQVVDQGELGSCTANALAYAHEFDQMKQKAAKPFSPSRLFIYYNERVMEKTVNSDAGAQLRDGIKSIAKQGVCPETLWPYDIAKFAKKPTAKAYKEALKHKALSYQRMAQTLTQLKGRLASGYPFVFGFTVYASFDSDEVARTGIVPLPQPNEEVLGGHAVMAVGYDDSAHIFIVQNSWGPGWGDQGFFYMPYTYLTAPALAADFWTIRLVAGV